MPSPSYVPVAPNRLLYAEVADAFPVTGTTAQTTTPLAAQVEVGRTYVVMAGIVWSCTSAAANVGLSWSGPAGATLTWNNTTGSTGYRNAIGLVDSYTGSTAEREAFLLGRLRVPTTAGALAFTLSTSDSAATATLSAGSWLLLHRVA
jgi:hypothetical protein